MRFTEALTVEVPLTAICPRCIRERAAIVPLPFSWMMLLVCKECEPPSATGKTPLHARHQSGRGEAVESGVGHRRGVGGWKESFIPSHEGWYRHSPLVLTKAEI